MSAAPDPYGSGHHPVLASIASRSFFLSGQLLLGNLSKTVVVVGNAPHDRPGVLVGHLIGNRASFLCTKAPMVRVPKTNFLHGISSIIGQGVQAIFRRRRHQPRKPPLAKIRPGSPAPAMGLGTATPICAISPAFIGLVTTGSEPIRSPIPVPLTGPSCPD